MQLALDHNRKINLDMNKLIDNREHKEEQGFNESIFYYSERKYVHFFFLPISLRLRKIYSDDELHANIVALLLTLLLTTDRGTLDDLYNSQHPIINGKPNILFLLHFHLNHPSNQKVIPLILSRMAYIRPYPAG